MAIAAAGTMIVTAAGTVALIAAGMIAAIGTVRAGGRRDIMAGATRIAGLNGAGTTACASAAEVRGGRRLRLPSGLWEWRCGAAASRRL